MGDKGKNTKQNWLTMLQASMAAVAYAEANEPEMAREILNTGSTNDAVLFVVQDGHLHQRAVQYAINLCHRMDCGLAVLHISPSKVAVPTAELATVANPLEEMNNVPTSLHTASGELAKIVRRFVEDHRRIVSVVIDDASMGESNSKRRPPRQRKWWRELNCPVVFIPET